MTDSQGVTTELGKSVTSKAEETQQLQERQIGRDDVDAITPPLDPVKLAKLLEINTTHAKCVFAKSRYVAGFGISVVPHPEVDDPSEEQRKTARDFWFGDDSQWQVGPNQSERATASDVLQSAFTDFEGIGWLSMEMLTQTDGTPIGLAYVPAHSIRERKKGHGYVQLKANDAVYYGRAGDRYQDDRVFVDKETGDSGPSVNTPANELIYKRNHSPLYENYGTPDIVPGMKDIEGDEAARDFNIDFFTHNAVPRLAVIVENGELTEGARESIRKLIHDMKDADHRTVILEAEKMIEQSDNLSLNGEDDSPNIRIEPLTVGMEEDASFRGYRDDLEAEILKVHDVPPVIAGRVESGAFSTDAEQQRLEFAEETIAPKQHDFADLLYEVIHKQALGVTDWTIEFKLSKPDMRLTNAEVAQTRIRASQGVMTVNEAREELGLEQLDGGVGNMLLAEVSSPAVDVGIAVDSLVDQRMADVREDLHEELRTEQRLTPNSE